MDALVISHLLVLLIAMATDSFAQVPTKQPEVVTFSITRSDTFFRPTKVTLSCMSTEDLRDARYLRKLNGQTDLLNIVDENGVETQGDQVTFEVTPDLEGVYFCENGNVTSLNQVEIVAYPLQNLTISGISRYSISLGQDVTLLCAYDTPGALRQRYHVEWYRGRKPIYNKDTPLPPRYEINDNDFSLTIRNTTVEDSSKGYYCALNVQNVESPDDIYRVGPTFELEINERIKVSQPIMNVAEKEGSSRKGTFTCAVRGSPKPTIAWLFQGTEMAQLPEAMSSRLHQEDSVDETTSAITVTSSLVVSGLEDTDSGSIHCVAFNYYFGSVNIVSSAANLVVLTNKFTVELQAQLTGTALIKATLPTIIPGTFSLVVRYLYDITTTVDAELFDIAFTNTREILYEIPKHQLPGFRVFRVRVALKANDVQGDFTQASNQITTALSGEIGVPTGSSAADSCDCGGSDSSIPVWVFLILVVVMVIAICIVIGIVTIVYFVHRSKPKVSSSAIDMADDFTDGDYFKEHDRSHTSRYSSACSSHTRQSRSFHSRSSRRSSYSSRSRSRSHSRSRSRSRSHSESRSRSGTPHAHEAPDGDHWPYSDGAERNAMSSPQLAEIEELHKESTVPLMVEEISSEDEHQPSRDNRASRGDRESQVSRGDCESQVSRGDRESDRESSPWDFVTEVPFIDT